MPTMRAQVVLNHVNGLPRDAVVNTFHFLTPGATAQDFEGIRSAILDFYNAPRAGTTDSVSKYLSASISRAANAHKIKVYTLEPGPEGPPDYETTFDINAAGNIDKLPHEVALCISFYATKSQARRRGRLYIGPLNTQAMDQTASGEARPGNEFRLALAAAGGRLTSTLVPDWAVFSRVDNVARAVTGGWVDNAFDTQRSRGLRADLRTTFGDAPT